MAFLRSLSSPGKALRQGLSICSPCLEWFSSDVHTACSLTTFNLCSEVTFSVTPSPDSFLTTPSLGFYILILFNLVTFCTCCSHYLEFPFLPSLSDWHLLFLQINLGINYLFQESSSDAPKMDQASWLLPKQLSYLCPITLLNWITWYLLPV